MHNNLIINTLYQLYTTLYKTLNILLYYNTLAHYAIV